ncbi:MAG: formate dehydrogenase accessory sulfurtransferase FdhD [Euzebyales bacterium]|nr:formate dehydrogenase accessory sulfurtransferase FdhD [Euzebyales bacterium]
MSRTAKVKLVRVGAGQADRRLDRVAAEGPLQIRVDGTDVAVTMRTPGDDVELALGFCLTEGIVEPGEVMGVAACPDAEGDVVEVRLRGPRPVTGIRNVYTTSSCGICGTAALDGVRRRLPPVGDDPVTVDPAVLAALPDRLRDAQPVFARTGGLHAAGLATPEGELLAVCEDVGRHNAVDKLVGRLNVAGRLPAAGHVLIVSGRIAFEIVQKALWARVPVLAAVSAPTSLAIELAEQAGMTLAGFVRGGSMNVYSRADRLGA